MQSSVVKVAVVGTGGIVPAHVAALASLPRFQLASLCSLDDDLPAKAGRLSVPGFRDYRDAFRTGPNVVVIAVPHDLHFEIARAALESGAHVLVEKPIALSVTHLNVLLAIAEERDRRLMVADTAYTAEPFVSARGVLERLDFGAFVSGHYLNHRHYFTSERPAWFLDPVRSGGGQFINIGVHRVAAVRTLLGDGMRESGVWASVRHPGRIGGVEAATTAMVRYATGQCMVYEEYGYLHPPGGMQRWSLRLMFDRGCLMLGPGRISSSDLEGRVTEWSAAAQGGSEYLGLYRQLLRAIDGQSFYPTGLHGAADARVALAAYASSESGRCIDLGCDEWRLYGEAGHGIAVRGDIAIAPWAE